MLSVHIKIPGQWRDLWLYKNKILLWDRLGHLSYLDVPVLGKYLSKRYGVGTTLLAQMLIFRNDWKVGEQSKLMLSVPEIEAAFLGLFHDREHVDLEIPRSLFRQTGSEAYPGAVLDTCIYANRLYLATADGLLESYINPKHPDREYRLDRQLECRVAKLAVQYAAINAAAEDEGLFFGRVIFADERDGPGFWPSKFQRVAERSLSVSHASRNLLNYAGESAPNFFRARVESTGASDESQYRVFESQKVIGYDPPSSIVGLVQSTLEGEAHKTANHYGEDEAQVIGNSGYHLLTTVGEKLRVLNIGAFDEEEIEMRHDRNFSVAERTSIAISDVLETYSISGGFIVELPDSVQLINKAGSYELMKGSAARIRTFAHSLRHKESVAIIEDDTARLIGFHFSEEKLF